MEIDNPQLLPRTKGILVYGIYAHFLWLCHYTHTFVIDNPIFTKKFFLASRERREFSDVDQSIIKFSLLKNKMSFRSRTNLRRKTWKYLRQGWI